MTSSNFQSTINWYEQHAEEYADQIADSPDIDLMNLFIGKVGIGATILDAGCAGGRDCRIFKDEGLHPIGIDITHSLIEVAKNKNPDIEFLQGSFLKLPFDDNTFDGVWAHASLVHLEKISEVKKALSEFHRVLKAHGIIHTSVKAQTGEEKTIHAAHTFSGDFKRFFRLFTKQEVESLLKESGFQITEIKETVSERKEITWIIVFAKKV